jgi:hypothetical protein
MNEDTFAMATLLSDPEAVVGSLMGADTPIFGIRDARVCLHDQNGVVLELVLAPWVPCAAAGFRSERIRLLATAERRVHVVPWQADKREWKHRNPTAMGELCLWCPDDDAALTWQWSDGLPDLITITHRHLQYEEYWRRTGNWPVEDAPHGTGSHALRSNHMRDAAHDWRR